MSSSAQQQPRPFKSWHVESIGRERVRPLHQWCNDNSDELDVLNRQMWTYYENNRMTSEDTSVKLKLIDDLYVALSSKLEAWGPYWRLVLTGSSLTMLGEKSTKTSDIDVCIQIPMEHNQDVDTLKLQKVEALTLARHALDALQRENEENDVETSLNFISSQLIREARVPVLKISALYNNHEVELDLSVSFNKWVSGLYNTHLLAAYSRFDARFSALCIFVKRWAKRHSLYGPTRGRFNSYSLCLLVLHYLQCGTFPPVLPNLQKLMPDRFPNSEKRAVKLPRVDFRATTDRQAIYAILPTEERELLSSEVLPLADLFVGFLDYYSSYDFAQYFPSIRRGRSKRREKAADTLFGRSAVLIEDPVPSVFEYETNNSARTVMVLDEVRHTFQFWRDRFRLSEAEQAAKAFDQTSFPNFLELFGTVAPPV